MRLVPATQTHFALLLDGQPPEPEVALPDTPVAEPEVLAMLAGLAEAVSALFTPSAWLIVAGDELVGLMSVTSVLDEDGCRSVTAWRRARKGAATLRQQWRPWSVGRNRTIASKRFTQKRALTTSPRSACWSGAAL